MGLRERWWSSRVIICPLTQRASQRGFDIDIDINIAKAKRSAINLCNGEVISEKQAIDGPTLSEIFLCLPAMKGDSRLPIAMSDLGLQLYTAPKSPRKSPLTHTIKPRRSNLSLHQPQSLANDFHGDQNDSQQASSRFPLAHELAAALVPDSNSASPSLADEFGIEFEEEAEGIEEEAQQKGEIELPVPSTDPSADILSPRRWPHVV